MYFQIPKQLFIEDKELLLMGEIYGHLAHPSMTMG